jgi:ribonuclease VapC
MVIDTSAIVAILLDEPDGDHFTAAIEQDEVRLMSAVGRVEVSMVIEGRGGAAGRALLEQLLRTFGVEIVAVTPTHADIAIEAFRRFGRGRHKAALNMGDCFSYALAKALDVPLLCKGDDFAQTDIRVAA